MYESDKDRERYKRIRDAQLKKRDPGPKIKGVNWKTEPRPHKPFLVDLLDLLPSRYKGLAVGLVLGAVGLIACVLLLPGDFKVLGLLPLLICGVVGFVIGAVTDKDKWVDS